MSRMIEVRVESAENYQVRAFAEEPGLVATSTVTSLLRLARAAKRQAERSRASVWDKALGPFFSGTQVAAELNLSDDKVAELTRTRKVVGLLTTDGVWVYPTFQFDDRQLQADLAEVFGVLVSSGIDEWSAAGWLVARHRELDGKTAVEWLWSEPIDGALWLARDAAHRFSH